MLQVVADKLSVEYSGTPTLAYGLEAHKALDRKQHENLEEDYVIRDVVATAIRIWHRRHPTDPFGLHVDHTGRLFLPIDFNPALALCIQMNIIYGQLWAPQKPTRIWYLGYRFRQTSGEKHI